MGRMGHMEAEPAAKLGCRGVVMALALALVLPFFVHHCPSRSGRLPSRASELPAGGPGGGAPLRQAARAPACLEAWVLLRGYGGCPVLVGAGGYRLGLFCGAAGAPRGLLAFAGPFAGKAYLSRLPVPLGRWVHLAGMEPGDPWGSVASSPPFLSPPLVAFDGEDVTAGRPLAGAAAFPLGREPWPACEVIPVRLDGRLGAWRFSRRWRGLAEVAAARGAPWRLGALPPLRPKPYGAGGDGAAGKDGRRLGGLSLRGWLIVAVSLLLAGGMVATGLSLRVPPAGRSPWGRWPGAPFPPPSGRRPPVDLGALRRDLPVSRRRLDAGERTPGSASAEESVGAAAGPAASGAPARWERLGR
jgi:hypothetical protein